MIEWVRNIPLVILAGCSIIQLLNINWRVNIIALFVQYGAVFWLILYQYSPGLAAIKLLTGWMACALISSSHSIVHSDQERQSISGLVFQGITGLFCWALVFSIAPSIQAWLPGNDATIIGGSGLFVIGLLLLGMNSAPIRVVIGLLTVFSGFEILYSNVEASVLVTGLLFITNIGLSLVGVFALNMSNLHNTEIK